MYHYTAGRIKVSEWINKRIIEGKMEIKRGKFEDEIDSILSHFDKMEELIDEIEQITEIFLDQVEEDEKYKKKYFAEKYEVIDPSIINQIDIKF